MSAGSSSASGEAPAAAGDLSAADFLEAVEAIPGGFVIYDRDDRLLVANAAFREFHGDVAHLLVPGARFSDLLSARCAAFGGERSNGPRRCGVDCGPQCGDWLGCRTLVHGEANGVMFETTAEGRWVRVEEQDRKSTRLIQSH